MSILSFLHRLSRPTCPGCGAELIEWTDTWVRDGYSEERLWRGCPKYAATIDWEERSRHYARWAMGKRTRLVDLP